MNSVRIPIIAVVGPTASGKTALSIELAKRYNAEILSFDSMQLYKGMDIATAKPTSEEMGEVPHHMIGVVDPNEDFSVARYKKLADENIDDITARGKRVVMVGGTGLYLDAVLGNIEFLDDSRAQHIRAKLKTELDLKGAEFMYNRLLEIDPASAAAIHQNNTGRVLRALEVYETTGHTMSYQVENSRKTPSRYKPTYIGLTARDREYLYNRVNERVDMMMEKGLLEEAKSFAISNSHGTSKQAIGLKELEPYIRGERELAECVADLKQETRRYAKRQLTWFRRNKDIHWLYIDELTKDELVTEAEKIIEKEV